jgi:general secretion pathway protein A
MLAGVSQRKGLQVSIGPIGTGKTTLLYCLQHILEFEAGKAPLVRSAFLVNPTLSPSELLEALLDELEVRAASPSKPARLRAFHEVLIQSQRNNNAVLVIIDEAHLLSPELLEEVRLLLNLDSYSMPVLQLILSGQPELVPLLMKPQFAALRGRVAVVSKLRTLTFQEMRAYVAERLHVAGLTGESPFLTSTLQEIYRRTSGTPRLINLVCDRAMNAGFHRKAIKITPDLITDAVEDLTLGDELLATASNSFTDLAEAAISGETHLKTSTSLIGKS